MSLTKEMLEIQKRIKQEQDSLKNLIFHEIELTDSSKSLTFAYNGGFEVVSYERLKEIHELISKTLNIEKESYDRYKENFYENNSLIQPSDFLRLGFKPQE